MGVTRSGLWVPEIEEDVIGRDFLNILEVNMSFGKITLLPMRQFSYMIIYMIFS